MRVRGLAVGAVAGAALMLPAGASAFVFRPFQTPSKKIRCAYIGNTTRSAEIRCDLFFLNDVAYVVGPTGKARRIHISDTVADPKARTIAYGTSVRYGRYTCTSRTSGLTCRNRGTGHGFKVSRQSQRAF